MGNHKFSGTKKGASLFPQFFVNAWVVMGDTKVKRIPDPVSDLFKRSPGM
jgi:hypothetical protein